MSESSSRPTEGGDDEGTWIYSYADMISLLFCFFVLMYAATADREKVKEISKLLSKGVGGAIPVESERSQETQQDRALRAFEMLTSMLDLGDSVEDALGNIERKIAASKNAESFKQLLTADAKTKEALENLTQIHGSGEESFVTVVIPADIMFAPGEAKLLGKIDETLKQLAEQLSQISSDTLIEVVGHSDDAPLRSKERWASNWELSAARAAAVGERLRVLGIAGEKMQITGAAEFQPLVSPRGLRSSGLELVRQKNRRIEIRIRQKSSSDWRALQGKG